MTNVPSHGGGALRRIAVFVLPAIVVAACAHDERRPVIGPAIPEARSSPSSPLSQAQYLVADAPSKGAIMLPLGASGQYGLVVDRRRVIVGHGEPRVAALSSPDPIIGASKIPARFGGGFLFWTSNALYRSDAFDSKLLPVVRVPDPIETVSFAPKAVLTRTRNGERWALGLPNGERVAILPVGVADVQALDDGRAVGFNDQGAVFTSVDGGTHWVDATAQVKSSPTKVSTIGDELWLFESSSGASRLELDGRLSWFDKGPPETPSDLRAKDPRWRGADTPLRTVFHSGAALDDGAAIVIDSGDVIRIDVHTGEVVSIVPGRLPPDAQCEAVPISGDVLFACIARAGSSAFVVSHTLSSEPPVVEQTFSGSGGFFTSDDGGIVYTSSCAGVSPQQGAVPAVCVRMPGGRWEERDLAGLSSDGGSSDVTVARWIPRADGRVVAIVVDPSPGIYDPQAQTFQPIADEAREVVGHGAASLAAHSRFGKIRYKRTYGGSGFVDASWSFGPGNTLRGWQRHGESVEISEDGSLTRSPYSFDVVFAGALGLGRSKDGRLYQSSDHGASWVEVATPPSGIEAVDLVSCTNAGCDLGAFYRVGWAVRPPRIDPPKTPAPPAPEVRRVRGLELSCRPQGAVVSKALARTGDSPEDLGLGAARLPVASEKNDWGYVRNVVARSIVSPIHEAPMPDENTGPSLRALFSGFGTSRDGDIITVTGPNKSAMALRRGFSYVSPFDTSARIVRTGIAMSDVVAAGRRAGMTTDEILAEDFTETGSVIPLGSADASQPSDVAVHNADHGLLTVFRGERARVAIRSPQNSTNVVSGVTLTGADEAAFLELDSSGVGHVFKVGASGVSDLFDVSPTANETYYPANPDALAVGPKGGLAILRTPSGSDPASTLDPAFLIVQGMPPSPLSPWSELKFADDPICKAEQGGYRAVLQTVAPWVRVTTPELRVEDAPMIARVRWSAKRLCLEGFEVKLPAVSMRITGVGGEPVTFATWLVAKGSTFARVGVTEGIEWRQSLECTVVTTGP